MDFPQDYFRQSQPMEAEHNYIMKELFRQMALKTKRNSYRVNTTYS
jgi:hypothetical protein